MSSVPEGRAANQPFWVVTFNPPIALLSPGAAVSICVIFSPASTVASTSVEDSFARIAFWACVAGASRRSKTGSPYLVVISRYNSPGSLPRRAVISADKSVAIRPSLSVVQVAPSIRRNDAPALSSPPKPSHPPSSPSTKYLNPTGTSYSLRSNPAAIRSRMLLLTNVLPTAMSLRQMGRYWKR